MEISSTPRPQLATPVTSKAFGIRLGAYLIDSVAFIVGGIVIAFVVGLVMVVALTAAGHKVHVNAQAVNPLVNYATSLTLYTLYFVVFETLFGATLGKLILGLRVVKATGAPCDLRAAAIRALLRYVDGLLVGIPAYRSMRAHLNQRLGDRAAGTVVVGARDAVIQQPRAGWWFLVASALYFAVYTLATVFLSLGIYS